MNSTLIVYFILINSEGKAIIVDYKSNTDICDAGIGYETKFNCWETTNPKYASDDFMSFDINDTLKEPGIYEIDGYVDYLYAPEGCYHTYKVVSVKRISDLPYMSQLKYIEEHI